MDGVTFLDHLMRLRPMSVVMVSTLTGDGAEITLRALELGAVDFVFKPGTDLTGRFDAYSAEIIAKVKAAARSKPRIRTTVPTVAPRSEERRVGQERVSTRRSRWTPDHYKTKIHIKEGK